MLSKGKRLCPPLHHPLVVTTKYCTKNVKILKKRIKFSFSVIEKICREIGS